jgi:polyferredoxin
MIGAINQTTTKQHLKMKVIKIFISVLFLAYLCGAFFNASFNIAIWSTISRGAILILGLFFACVISLYAFADEYFD